MTHKAWQAVIGSRPLIRGNTVVAASSRGVGAWSARTGRPLWVAADKQFLGTLRVESCGSIVAALVGRASVPGGPGPNSPVANEMRVFDIRTGRRLWTHKLSGIDQQLGLACTPDLVAYADFDGQVIALKPRSGRPLWASAPPSTCAVGGAARPNGDVALAIEAGVVGVSRRCRKQFTAKVQGLDERTGRQKWIVDTPGDPTGLSLLFEFDGPRDTGVFLVRSRIPSHPPADVPTRRWSPAYSEPSIDDYQAQLNVLDVGTGKLLWREIATPADAFVSGGKGIVCLLGREAYECRRSANGELLTSQVSRHKQSPYDDTRAAAVIDGYAFELDRSTGRELLITRSVTTGKVVNKAPVAITERPFPGSDYGAGVAAASSRLVLVRRGDVPNTPIYALR